MLRVLPGWAVNITNAYPFVRVLMRSPALSSTFFVLDLKYRFFVLFVAAGFLELGKVVDWRTASVAECYTAFSCASYGLRALVC